MHIMIEKIDVILDRKMLADIAITDNTTFKQLVEIAKSAK